MKNQQSLRDQAWLEQLFKDTWDMHFSDVSRVNAIRVEFGRRAKRRLGSISIDRHNPSHSVIRLNGWFKETEVPRFLVKSVLVHELCHYAHGFNSGAERSEHRYPHAGGVVRREFQERGLEKLYDDQQKWLKDNWGIFIAKRYPLGEGRRTKKRPSTTARILRLLKS